MENKTIKNSVGLIIPTTSHKRTWNTWTDSLLYTTVQSFVNSVHPSEHIYTCTLFVGFDHDDPFYNNSKTRKKFKKFVKTHGHTLVFIRFPPMKKGFCTRMWNILFKVAFDHGCEYVYQCGDDIEWKTVGWITDCIDVLVKHDNIGVAGPINNNNRILTQTFVHTKTHFRIFRCYFSEKLMNWCCDDWINLVYSPSYLYKLTKHYCANIGGDPRYIIDGDPDFCRSQQIFETKLSALRSKCAEIASTDKQLITKYKQSI